MAAALKPQTQLAADQQERHNNSSATFTSGNQKRTQLLMPTASVSLSGYQSMDEVAASFPFINQKILKAPPPSSFLTRD